MNDRPGNDTAAEKSSASTRIQGQVASTRTSGQAYSYFPGCSLTGSAGEYDASFRLTCEALGIRLDEINDWNCCGASPAPHHVSGNLGVLLPARNLHIASEGHDAMVAPCAGCYNRLKNAQHELYGSEELREQATGVLQEPLRYKIEILNLVELFAREVSPETLAERAQGRLAGLNLATYYGCLLTRPARIMNFDNHRNPGSMKPLLRATGAQSDHFPFKSECCGSYVGLAKKEIVLRASRRVIEVAAGMGFDAIITACPLCHQNLDLRQGQINKVFGTSLDMPVLYYSQVLGLALGLESGDLGIDAHAISARKLLAKIGKGGVESTPAATRSARDASNPAPEEAAPAAGKTSAGS